MMKKVFMKSALIVFLAIVMLFGFTSCEEAGAVEPVVQEETVTILVPAFDDLAAVSGERGLTNMFNDDTYFACFDTSDPNPMNAAMNTYRNLFLSYAVMTTTPITPSLRPVSNVTLGLSASTDALKAKLQFDAYGFHVVVEDLGFDLDEKKLMIRYNIVEGSETVGIIDYVYNWRNKTFSYREMVMLTLFGDGVPAEAYTFGVLILEMHDVKLDVDLLGVPTGSYSTDSLKNGKLEKNAFADLIMVNCLQRVGDELEECIELQRSYLTISSKNGKIFSMGQPAEGDNQFYYVSRLSEDNPVKIALSSFFIHPTLAEVDPSMGGYGWNRKDLQFNWTVDPHSFRMDFLMDLADLVYSNSDIINEEGSSGVSASLSVKSGDQGAHGRLYYGDRFVAYDVNRGRRVGAATQVAGSTNLDTLVNNYWYEFANFHTFDSHAYDSYGTYTPHSDIVSGLIEDHLRNCGITNSNYIKNFQTAVRYGERYYNYDPADLHFIDEVVTDEDPNLFKKRLDDLSWIQDYKSRMVIVETANDGIRTFLINNSFDSPWCISGTYSFGSFVNGSLQIKVYGTGDPGDRTLTGLNYYPNADLDPGEPTNDAITMIVIPSGFTSVEANAITSAKYPNLQRVEVFSQAVKDCLPDDVKAKTVIIE
ncbi:MAG: hypothetical protein J5800_09535 [Spirochaetales bacterium]|nr:hypothetical protein [Spirochaetales bacterium]